MKPINFIGSNPEPEVWDLLMNCIICGFLYEQVKGTMAKEGYYLPEDQFILLEKLIDIQIDLDIGHRQKEWENKVDNQQ